MRSEIKALSTAAVKQRRGSSSKYDRRRVWTAAAILFAFSMFVTPSARATDVFSTLSGAGPSDFALLGLGNTFLNFSNVAIIGNVGVSSGGTLNNMAPSSISGNVYLDPAATYAGPGTVSGSFITQAMGSFDTSALNAAAQAAALAPSLTYSTINKATSISGNGGTTVIDITGGINLNNADLTLIGGANDHFIVNIAGNLNLTGTAALNVVGTPLSQVIYNFTSTGCTLNTHVGDTINGITLATDCGNSNLDGSFSGEIVYGTNTPTEKLTLLSGAELTDNINATVPEPSSFWLAASGSALLGIFLAIRKLRAV